MEQDADQLDAIAACCDITRRIVAITGKAGTGKTTIIREVYERLTAAGYSVACSAPTGKAAKRIRESTGIQAAQTNHRLLGYGMPIEHEEEDKDGNKQIVKLSTGPMFNRKRPLPYDVLLIDEYAMVNREIHDALIAALQPGARICMFGDMNQLKPIEENKFLSEAPSAFFDCLKKFDGIVLTTNHRQQDGSGVVTNAERILAGRIPSRMDDFNIIYTDDPVQRVLVFIDEQRTAGFDYSTIECQFVTCMNKSWIGTKKLNLSIQSFFWKREIDYMELPRYMSWSSGKHVARQEEPPIRVQIGTKVVYTANTYDLGNEQSVFNGEIGIVVNIDTGDGSVDIDLGDRIITVPPIIIVVKDDGRVIEQDPRRNIDLAYILTTHKMQGSEVKRVTYVLNKSTYYGQSRRNFYTAVTRAREHATVITDMGSIQKSVKFMG